MIVFHKMALMFTFLEMFAHFIVNVHFWQKYFSIFSGKTLLEIDFRVKWRCTLERALAISRFINDLCSRELVCILECKLLGKFPRRWFFFIGERFFSACSRKNCRYEILRKLLWGWKNEMPKAVSTQPKHSVKSFYRIDDAAKKYSAIHLFSKYYTECSFENADNSSACGVANLIYAMFWEESSPYLDPVETSANSVLATTLKLSPDVFSENRSFM